VKHIAPITIRRAHPEEPGVLRVAALDSARVPRSPLLVAEVDGEVRAVLSLDDGSAVADPFHRSLDLVELLRARAGAGERAPRRARLALSFRKPRSAY
jgi:hypothetical protein